MHFFILHIAFFDHNPRFNSFPNVGYSSLTRHSGIHILVIWQILYGKIGKNVYEYVSPRTEKTQRMLAWPH